MRVLAVLLECVAALHKHRTVSISKAVLPFIVMEYLRHHGSDNGLEAERNKNQAAREVSSDMPAHGQEAGEEWQNAKEQGDDLKGEQEPGHEEVMFVVAITVRNVRLHIVARARLT